MRRRDVIAALAGAATIPFPASAQARIRRIGMLLGIAEHDPEAQVRLGAMLDELQRLGWTSVNLGGPATMRSACAPTPRSLSVSRPT